MKILVINSGSSSLKYQLIDMETESVLAKGNCERIGIDHSKLIHKAKGETTEKEIPMENHNVAVKIVLDALTDKKIGVISSMDEIGAVAPRGCFRRSVQAAYAGYRRRDGEDGRNQRPCAAS